MQAFGEFFVTAACERIERPIKQSRVEGASAQNRVATEREHFESLWFLRGAFKHGNVERSTTEVENRDPCAGFRLVVTSEVRSRCRRLIHRPNRICLETCFNRRFAQCFDL